jgi:hypothetical protein
MDTSQINKDGLYQLTIGVNKIFNYSSKSDNYNNWKDNYYKKIFLIKKGSATYEYPKNKTISILDTEKNGLEVLTPLSTMLEKKFKIKIKLITINLRLTAYIIKIKMLKK